MKIMHIGDLHIGRTINQHVLLEDQKELLDQIIHQVDKEQIDVLVIAGDIYDRSIPSKEAMQLYEAFILQINMTRQIPVLAVSGNHDGAERLGHAKSYFRQHHYYLSTALDDCFTPVTIENTCFYLVPYIEPASARIYFDDETIRTHHDTYQAIIQRIEQQLDYTYCNILVSHLFVAGGEVTDSERDLVVGTIENVPKALFSAFDYTMLGHLHTPDAIKDDKVYYSGSIMRYSFNEVGQRKGYRIFDTEEKTVTFQPLKAKRDLEVGKGTFEDAMHLRLNVNQDAYLKLELSEMEAVNDPMTKLKTIYPYLLELKPILQSVEHEVVSKDVTTLSPIALIQSFYEEMTDETLDNEQMEVLHEMLNEGSVDDEA
ncbi:exonuclease SbcCD subunit D [Macrococcus capreoli]|uniref:exonuclease SbcCD subunit D n=1 Tax=Macrococcus capreoli TaxID=2982690 RepID=UPI0021D59647|nr:exonuclease SbcCD subunit D [Macrococcus sp. TMW 2.2395]MCU7558646.1 exonuclease SbcCD subunit D [Macrococcus sp. TMW 2.2395]